MGTPRLGKKFGKPLAPELEFNFPVPDRALPTSPSQNVSWAQWMDEIEPWVVKFHSKPHFMDPNMERFVLD